MAKVESQGLSHGMVNVKSQGRGLTPVWRLYTLLLLLAIQDV